MMIIGEIISTHSVLVYTFRRDLRPKWRENFSITSSNSDRESHLIKKYDRVVVCAVKYTSLFLAMNKPNLLYLTGAVNSGFHVQTIAQLKNVNFDTELLTNAVQNSSNIFHSTF